MGVGLAKSVASDCMNKKMLNRLFGRAVGREEMLIIAYLLPNTVFGERAQNEARSFGKWDVIQVRQIV